MPNDPALLNRSTLAFTPGSAYWNQRNALAATRERILALSQAVNRPSDLTLFQYAQLFASALEFAPDLIVELGRGTGNSTCAFTEAANQLSKSATCRVLSLCNTPDWETTTVPKVRAVVPPDWFSPLDAQVGDIMSFDFRAALSGATRVLLFWDAHGFEIAERVLGVIMPELANRAHIVLMHDMSDSRYAGYSDYGGNGLWKGVSAGNTRFRIDNVDSAVAQAISILDFTKRNNLTLDSAEHSIDVEIGQAPGRSEEMTRVVGDELFSMQGHWFWFTLNEHAGPFTFPRFTL
jgi:hypothetical protein